MAGLYIHIPFCRQVCRYCDFHFSVNTRRVDDMVAALVDEIGLQREYLGGAALQTVYWGGGTPSLLQERHLNMLLEAIHRHFAVLPSCEMTLEANPDDLTTRQLQMYRQLSIRRLSIGIQSFCDPVLRFLNRSHDAQTAQRSVVRARRVGFDNLSIDLLYAIPGLSHKTWAKTLHTALELAPEHLSAYALTVEKRTVFGRWLDRHELTPARDDDSAAQFKALVETLEKEGYEHYEISNFCLPGFRATHNSHYWQRVPYLGIGPGAHSFNGHSRQANIRNNTLYMRAIQAHRVPCQIEALSRENNINEYLFTSLRTAEGCDFNFLEREYRIDMRGRHKAYLTRLEAKGLAFMEGGRLKLTLRGKLVADSIVVDLFVVEEE